VLTFKRSGPVSCLRASRTVCGPRADCPRGASRPAVHRVLHVFLFTFLSIHLAVCFWLHNVCVGNSHRGPLKNWGKPIFFRKKQNTNEFTNLKHAQDNHGLVAGAHGPGGPSGPPEQSAPATLGRNSASLEGHSTVLTRLRLARGLDAPSGEVPPRSRAGHPLA
jgi:hypothetical protein